MPVLCISCCSIASVKWIRIIHTRRGTRRAGATIVTVAELFRVRA